MKVEQDLMIWLNSAAFINHFFKKFKWQFLYKIIEDRKQDKRPWNSFRFYKRHNWENQSFVSHISIYRNMPVCQNFWFAEIFWDTIIWMNAELGLTVLDRSSLSFHRNFEIVFIFMIMQLVLITLLMSQCKRARNFTSQNGLNYFSSQF